LSKTFLQGVNEVLNRAGITTQSGELSTFDTPSKRVYIDLAIQIWNETVDQVCNEMGIPHPDETAETTITLVTGQREYTLPTNLVQIRWPLMEPTEGNSIEEYAGGYEQMRYDQSIPDDWTGLPYAACINPTTGDLRMERTPTADENGLAYNLLYDKDLAMSDENDTFPFSDAVFRALVPVVTEGWERKKRNDFDLAMYNRNLARALHFANKVNRRTHW